MNRTLWVVQTVVALAFLVAGLMMMLQPIERLKQGMNWVAHSPRNVVRLVGIMAILGSLGLVFPGLTHILPWLTPVAAALLGLMMFWNTMTSRRACNCGIALVLVATPRNGIPLTFLSFGAKPQGLKSGRKHQRLKSLRSRCQSATCAVLLAVGSVPQEKPLPPSMASPIASVLMLNFIPSRGSAT